MRDSNPEKEHDQMTEYRVIDVKAADNQVGINKPLQQYVNYNRSHYSHWAKVSI